MTDFWAPDTEELATAARARSFWEPTVEELFNQQQDRNVRLARHRAAIRNERPEERARRQEHRAWQMAQQLGSTRPNVVKAMLALVQADEKTVAEGDPAEGRAPGARAALKPAPKRPPKKAAPVAKRNNDEQMGFWE